MPINIIKRIANNNCARLRKKPDVNKHRRFKQEDFAQPESKSPESIREYPFPDIGILRCLGRRIINLGQKIRIKLSAYLAQKR